MISENRNDIRVVEAIAASPNISSVNVWSPGRIDNLEIFVPSFVSAVLGFFAGLTYGQWKYDVTEASFALGFILAWLSYNAFHFADKLTGITRYGARWWDVEEEQEEHPAAMIQTGNDRQIRLLTNDMRKLLNKFGRYYPRLQSFGVNKWEARPARMQRDDLKKLLDYLRIIGAVEGTMNERKLTEWGEQQLEKWANNNFDELFEMQETALPPDGRHTPAQEVAIP